MEGTVQRKALSDFELKAEDGVFRATIATFGVVDLDGDVTFPGAFPVGKSVIVGGYNHSSMPPQNALPTGKAVIGADNSRAWIDGRFLLDTPQGKQMYDTVKSLGSTEWSYAYAPTKVMRGSELTKLYPNATRGLLAIDPVEASPVVKGAGIGTGTDFIKSAGVTFEEKAVALFDQIDELLEEKAGRALSAATRARLQAVCDELQRLMDESMPPDMADMGKNAALTFEPKVGYFDLALTLAKARGGYRA